MPGVPEPGARAGGAQSRAQARGEGQGEEGVEGWTRSDAPVLYELISMTMAEGCALGGKGL